LSFFLYNIKVIKENKSNMVDARLKILPPWTIVIRKIEALFDGDP